MNKSGRFVLLFAPPTLFSCHPPRPQRRLPLAGVRRPGPLLRCGGHAGHPGGPGGGLAPGLGHGPGWAAGPLGLAAGGSAAGIPPP
jgi:hypothetical protein